MLQRDVVDGDEAPCRRHKIAPSAMPSTDTQITAAWVMDATPGRRG